MPAVPKYARVVDAIREQIRSGALKPGDRLPTTEQLQQQFDVGYGTLRSALMLLEAEGLIEGRPGDGRYVRSSG